MSQTGRTPSQNKGSKDTAHHETGHSENDAPQSDSGYGLPSPSKPFHGTTFATTVEPVMLAAARIGTFLDDVSLTNASGFFFERDNRLFVVTSRHVVVDEPTKHYPDRIEVELHTDPVNMTASIAYSIPLYRDGKSLWRQGQDSAGEIDVAVIEIDRGSLPESAVYRSYTPAHLATTSDQVHVGASLLVVGFPLGFHDTLHHMPVVRQAVIASSFGIRFQGEGFFLTDARTHRGISGAPVIMQVADNAARLGDLPWLLLGVHSSRFDVGTRDLKLDEALGLNCAWYADILLTLTGTSQT